METGRWNSTGRSGLIHYVMAAALARTADGGAITGWDVRIPLMVGIGLIGCAVGLSFTEWFIERSGAA